MVLTIVLPYLKAYGDDRPPAGNPFQQIPPKAPMVVLEIPLAEGKVTLFKNREPSVELNSNALCLPYPMDLTKKRYGFKLVVSESEIKSRAFHLKQAFLNWRLLNQVFLIAEKKLEKCRTSDFVIHGCSDEISELEFLREELRDPITNAMKKIMNLLSDSQIEIRNASGTLPNFEKAILRINLAQKGDCKWEPRMLFY